MFNARFYSALFLDKPNGKQTPITSDYIFPQITPMKKYYLMLL